MSEFMQAMKEFGPWVALAVFLVWQLVRDKAELVKTSREDREKSTQVHEQSIKAIENNTASMSKLSDSVSGLTTILHERPCLAKEHKK